jgi:hypothetical protein
MVASRAAHASFPRLPVCRVTRTEGAAITLPPTQNTNNLAYGVYEASQDDHGNQNSLKHGRIPKLDTDSEM